jgi:hypothetical protein
MKNMKHDNFVKEEVRKLSTILSDLQDLYLEYALADPKSMVEYFSFCRELIVKCLSARSIDHKQFGQEMLHNLIMSVHGSTSMARGYVVKGAGLDSANGTYIISPSKHDTDGYLIPSADAGYERMDQETGKKFVLFLSSFEDGEKTWCLSEEHDDEPIPSEYTDFYINDLGRDQRIPPLSGWESVEESEDPAPSLEALPQFIHLREEHKSLKQDLATWFLEKNVISLILNTKTSPSTDEASVTKLVGAIDAFIKNENKCISDKMSNLLVSILPPISNSSTATLQSNKPSSKASYETAKMRLESAKRWHQNTARMLLTAQTEHNAATKEMEEAQKALEQLERLHNTALDDNSVSVTDSVSLTTSSITHDDIVPTVPKRTGLRMNKKMSTRGARGGGTAAAPGRGPNRRRSLDRGSSTRAFMSNTKGSC